MLLVVTQEKRTTAAAAVSIVREATAELPGACADRFAPIESRRLAADAVAGLQADLPEKNCWTIAKNAGHGDPRRLQHFFADGAWDEGGIGEHVAEAAWEQIADAPSVSSSSTRPETSRKARTRWGSSASTPAPPAEPRTRR
ncbi:hypothetical protein GCM10027447_27770 [Glycomyces halotolerans]